MTRVKKRTDPRILRTRRALRMALLELIREKGLEQISVKQITDRAGLNRTTFYLHYQNLEELLAGEFDLLRELVAGAFPPSANRPPGIIRDPDRKAIQLNFQNLEEQAPLLQAVLGWYGGKKFRRQLVNDLLKKSQAAHVQPALEDEILSQTGVRIYHAAGYLGLLEWWLEEGCPLTPEQITSLVLSLSKTSPEKDRRVC